MMWIGRVGRSMENNILSECSERFEVGGKMYFCVRVRMSV